MKSNMSSLTKKLLFFLVFVILSNFTTSDDTRIQNCINNVNRIFYSNEITTNFTFALFALSEDSITSSLLATDADTLIQYFQKFKSVCQGNDNENFISRYYEVIGHFEFLDSLNNYNDVSSSDERQNDLLGYFKSFVAHFGNDEFRMFGIQYVMAQKVDNSIWSPWTFCGQLKTYEKIDIYDCIHALSIMFDLKGDPSENIEDTFYHIKGSEAFKMCYLKYTYLDFHEENSHFDFTIQKYQHESTPSINQYVLDKQSLINIMIKYFSHLVEKSSIIGQLHNELIYPETLPVPIGRSIFLTVDEYCRAAAMQNRS